MADSALHPHDRRLGYRYPSTVMACLAAIAILALGLRGVFDPAGAALAFGSESTEDGGLSFMATTGARNIGLALLAIAFIYYDLRKALALLLMMAAVIAALDFWIVSDASSFAKAGKHLGYLGFLLGFGFFFLRKEQQHGY